MREWLRILLVGDEEVGKSSIISTYISKQFPYEVPDVMFDAKLPPKCSSNNTGVILVDSSQDLNKLRQQIVLSDCIVCVFDAARPDTLNSISSTWLPLIQECGVAEPTHCNSVIIACNKDDLLEEDQKRASLDQMISQLMQKFPFVKDYVVTSPKTNISSLERLIYASESAVIFPKEYLFNHLECSSHKNFQFSPCCARALTRIFRWFDTDYDGLLSNTELQQLDMYCFNIQTSLKDVENVKNTTSKKVAGGVKDNKVTLSGFFDMMKRILVCAPGDDDGGDDDNSNSSSRCAATSTGAASIWTILRACGYDNTDQDCSCPSLQLILESPQLNLLPAVAVGVPTLGSCRAASTGSCNAVLGSSKCAELSPSAVQFICYLVGTCASLEWDAGPNNTAGGECWIPWESLAAVFSVIAPVHTPSAGHLLPTLATGILPGNGPPLRSRHCTDGSCCTFNYRGDSMFDVCDYVPAVHPFLSYLPTTTATPSEHAEADVSMGKNTHLLTRSCPLPPLTGDVLQPFNFCTCDASGIDSDRQGCSLGSWISQWQLLAATYPMYTQVLLYQLGYDADNHNDAGCGICIETSESSAIALDHTGDIDIAAHKFGGVVDYYASGCSLRVAVLGECSDIVSDIRRSLTIERDDMTAASGHVATADAEHQISSTSVNCNDTVAFISSVTSAKLHHHDPHHSTTLIVTEFLAVNGSSGVTPGAEGCAPLNSSNPYIHDISRYDVVVMCVNETKGRAGCEALAHLIPPSTPRLFLCYTPLPKVAHLYADVYHSHSEAQTLAGPSDKVGNDGAVAGDAVIALSSDNQDGVNPQHDARITCIDDIVQYIEQHQLLPLIQWHDDGADVQEMSVSASPSSLVLFSAASHSNATTSVCPLSSGRQLLQHIYTLQHSCQLGVPIQYQLQYFQMRRNRNLVSQRSRMFCGFVVSGVVSMGVYCLYRPMIDPVIHSMHKALAAMWLQTPIGGVLARITGSPLQLLREGWNDCCACVLTDIGLQLQPLQPLHAVCVDWLTTNIGHWWSVYRWWSLSRSP